MSPICEGRIVARPKQEYGDRDVTRPSNGVVMKLEVVVLTAILLTFGSDLNAAEIKLLASGATKEVLVELIPAFEKQSGHKVVSVWSGGADIRKRVGAGEAYDVVIVAANDIDAFIQQRKLIPGSRTDLMKTGVGVAVRAGSPKPDVGSRETLKAALVAATSVGYSTGPSGDHIIRLLDQLGIADVVRPKLKQVPSGVAVASIIASGQADLGVQQVSELIHYPGIEYLGPLPTELQNMTTYAAGVGAATKDAEAAASLTSYLHSPAATPLIRHHGMEPG